jgi:hypothetical protein
VLRVVRSAAEVRFSNKALFLGGTHHPHLFCAHFVRSLRQKADVEEEEFVYSFSFSFTFLYMAYNIPRKGCFKCGNRASLHPIFASLPPAPSSLLGVLLDPPNGMGRY